MTNHVCVLAPLGRDGALIVEMLRRHDIDAFVCRTIGELCDSIEKGIDAAVITEEALAGAALDCLTLTLAKQPTWSDLPLIILTTSGEGRAEATWNLIRKLDPVGNVSLLERPLRSITLLSAVHVALRSRRRQYEVKSFSENLERRVAERTQELVRLNQEAEGFNYSISHDLRSPLRAIVSTSMMLLQDYGNELPEDAVFYLKRQAEASKKLAILIDDLLTLSRLSRQEMRVQNIDLTHLTKEVVEEIVIHRKESCERFDIQPGMVTKGDPLLLRFVMLNLLQNACKFSPDGGSIEVGQRKDGIVFVRDHGIGFDMKYSAKLFLPFERLVRDDEFPGTGIGLANVLRIIRRHGGDIWAESKPGEGATFFFRLA